MPQPVSRTLVSHGKSNLAAGIPRFRVRSARRGISRAPLNRARSARSDVSWLSRCCDVRSDISRTVVLALFLGLFGVVGCAGGGGDATAADSLSSSPPRALEDPYGSSLRDSASIAADSSGEFTDADSASCPMTGLWRQCNVEKRLERSGFVIRPGSDSVAQPGLLITGTVVRLGRAELQLYFYADSADAHRQADALDVGAARPADATDVLREPRLIRSNNLLALFFNNNDRQLERVELALTAGLPTR